MLKGIPQILSPELLMVLCEMGHGDRIVISDGNFPAESMGKDAIAVSYTHLEKFEEVYKALWEVGEKYGAKKMGNQAYVMNHTEGGFPNLNMHYPCPWFEDEGLAAYLAEHPMEGFYNWNRYLICLLYTSWYFRTWTPRQWLFSAGQKEKN